MHRFVILLSMVAAVFGSDSFFSKYAFSKVMSSCFGEEVYSDYLGMLGAAKQRCQQYPVFIGGISDLIILPVLMEPNDKKPKYAKLPSPLSKDVKIKGRNKMNIRPLNEPIDHTIGSDGKEGLINHYSEIYQEENYNTAGTDETDRYMIHQPKVNPKEEMTLQSPKFVDADNVHRTIEKVKATISNFTCTLREIGYIDDDLKIKKNFLLSKYLHSPIDEDLKSDLINILVDCQQYKKCFPESSERYGIPVALQRLIKVVQCEKVGTLTACFKHDLRKDIDQLGFSESSNGNSPVEDLERMVSLLIAADALGDLEMLH